MIWSRISIFDKNILSVPNPLFSLIRFVIGALGGRRSISAKNRESCGWSGSGRDEWKGSGNVGSNRGSGYRGVMTAGASGWGVLHHFSAAQYYTTGAAASCTHWAPILLHQKLLLAFIKIHLSHFTQNINSRNGPAPVNSPGRFLTTFCTTPRTTGPTGKI